MDQLTAMDQALNMNILDLRREITANNNLGSSSTNPRGSSNTSPSNPNDYDGIFISPLIYEIPNFPLPPNHKIPKFEMFNGEQDPKQHLISFQ